MTHILKLNGDSYIEMPDFNMEHSGDYTIEVWVRADALSADGSAFLVKKAVGESVQYGIKLNKGQGVWSARGYYGETGVIETEISDLSNTWRHIALAVCFSKPGHACRAVLYIDGEPREISPPDTSEPITPILASNLYLGNGFRGAMADVRIWNVERTGAEIKSNMRHLLTGREPGLIVYLPLFEGEGAIKEYVFKRKTTPFDIAWEKQASPIIKPTDSCLNMQWENHYAKADAFDGFPSVRITVEFWAKTFNTSDHCVLFSYNAGDGPDAFCVKKAGSLVLGVGGEEIDSGVSVADGEWRHVAVSWHALTGKTILYKDGVEMFSGELAPGKYIPTSGGLILGRDSSGLDALSGGNLAPPFEGRLCDVRIWSVIRSQKEIVQDMFFRLAGDEPYLEGCWRLDEGVGNQALNSRRQRPDLDLIGSGMWRDSALFLKDPPTLQTLAMRDQMEGFDSATYESRIADLLKKIGELESAALPVSFDETLENLNKQISEARKNSKEKYNYYIGDVNMELKAIPLSGGSGKDSKIIFPTATQLGDMEPDQLSAINVKFLPRYDRENVE